MALQDIKWLFNPPPPFFWKILILDDPIRADLSLKNCEKQIIPHYVYLIWNITNLTISEKFKLCLFNVVAFSTFLILLRSPAIEPVV